MRHVKLIFLFWLFSFYSIAIVPCSIVGYIGSDWGKSFILTGLSRLEYRGYDSAGYCTLDVSNHHLITVKAVGTLDVLKRKLMHEGYDGHIGIGHTRWATHGAATENNAHPHLDCHHDVAVVHNGIIENYYVLKKWLIKQGHQFVSETDTEVIPHILKSLLDHHKEDKNPHNKIKQVAIELAQKLEGSYGFISMMKEYPNMLLAMRRSSPLSVGIGNDQMYIASDVLAYADKTSDVIFLPDESFALITKDQVDIYDFHGNPLEKTIKKVYLSPAAYEKMQHEHFMLKEIYEQPRAIRSSIKHYQSLGDKIFKQCGLSSKQVKQLESVHIIGCGTSWHAGLIGKFFFEYIAKIPTYVHLASEFRYMPLFAQKNSLFLAISQSGETADTLEAIRMVKKHHLPVATITNVVTSTMVRETDGYVQTIAGPEIAVASTKAFTTQLTALYWLAHMIAKEKGLIGKEGLTQAAEKLTQAADILENAIETYKVEIINNYVKTLAKAPHMMFLGRHIMYPFALESALKLKEISYIPSHGGPAGELKHGTLALVDFQIPVVLFSHVDPLLYKKIIANAQEVKARKGKLIIYAFEGQTELCDLADISFVIPRVDPLLAPLAFSGLMQFFVYQIAKELKRNIDKPRNLAKSVTVE